MRRRKNKVKFVGTYEFEFNFDKIIDEAYYGRTFVITKDNKIVAKLEPYCEKDYMESVNRKLNE